MQHSTAADAPIRILVASIPSALQDSAGGAYLREVLVPVTQRNAGRASRPDTRLVFRFASNGAAHPAFAAFHYIPNLNPAAMITVVEHADQQGYDAAIVGCFGDPFLAEIRAAARIPVIGFGEAALQEALTLGRRIGVITPSPVLLEPTRAQLLAYGMADQLAGIVATTEPAGEQEHGLCDATGCIDAFLIAGRQLIAAGADVLVPGCGLMSPALRMAPGLESRLPHGVSEVDGIPVVDVIGAAVRAAERAVSTARADDARHTAFAALRPPFPTPAHSSITLPGLFWDCH